MAKRLKLRLSRVFQTCYSKDPSDPVPSFLRLPPPNPPLPVTVHSPDLSPHPPSHTPIKRHVIRSALGSYGCGCGSTDHLSDDDCTRSHPPNHLRRDNHLFHRKHEPDFHVVAAKPYRKMSDQRYSHETTPRRKMYSSSVVNEAARSRDVDLLPVRHASIIRDKKKKKRRSNKKKMTMAATGSMSLRVRISTSSGDTGGFFSSEDHEDRDKENEDEVVEREGDEEEEEGEEENETLVSSSKSFSMTDSSSEFNPHRRRIKKNAKSSKSKKKKNKKKKEVKKKKAITIHGGDSEVTEAARLSVFRRMIPCTIDGKVRESFAVVKSSEDPYEDFKRSMLEMISEKEMFEEEDLVQLLHCFLSLNSKCFHGVIVEAFLEIWEGLFGVIGDSCSSSSSCIRRRSV